MEKKGVIGIFLMIGDLHSKFVDGCCFSTLRLILLPAAHIYASCRMSRGFGPKIHVRAWCVCVYMHHHLLPLTRLGESTNAAIYTLQKRISYDGSGDVGDGDGGELVKRVQKGRVEILNMSFFRLSCHQSSFDMFFFLFSFLCKNKKDLMILWFNVVMYPYKRTCLFLLSLLLL
jgi:hypothetical protein